MSKRDAARLARQHGATVAEKPGPNVDIVVVGEEGLSLIDDAALAELLGDDFPKESLHEVVPETELWRRLSLVEIEAGVHRLYTPAMLAELLGVEPAVIRRWHRRGLITPVREVRRLPYFDFQEVAAARRLAELLAAGVSPASIEKKLAALARYLPGVERPLAQLSLIVEGRQILLRQGDGLIEPGGQLHFDFDVAADERPLAASPDSLPKLLADSILEKSRAELSRMAREPDDLLELAAELEESGDLAAAVDTYRAVMAAMGPTPELCFQTAELLFRLGDLPAARERYFMAVELDEDFVEARANLGCVLAEQGRLDLAAAAFQGALALHPDYADVHYHLARTLDRLGERKESLRHWEAFLRISPENPWADEARARLDEEHS